MKNTKTICLTALEFPPDVGGVGVSALNFDDLLNIQQEIIHNAGGEWKFIQKGGATVA